ncbi:GH23570 [Drosophila grimshawi]|uniref:GH23570 n=1 Tax=Drosophila grimshawi TaxID=7222 RepID=B4K120_DROGR|nr:GH23570 [Drosophila grimshawi]
MELVADRLKVDDKKRLVSEPLIIETDKEDADAGIGAGYGVVTPTSEPDITMDGVTEAKAIELKSMSRLVKSPEENVRETTNSANGIVFDDDVDLDIEKFAIKGAMPKHLTDLDEAAAAEEKRLIQQLSKDDFAQDYLLQNIFMLQLRLVEAQKALQAERDEKHELHKSIEKLALELQDVRGRQEELRSAKQEAVPRENLERRLSELRTELEHLQRNKEISEVKMSHVMLKKMLAETNTELGHAEQYEAEVHNERKKARVESKQLNIKQDVAMKEAYSLKREKNDLELQITQLKKEMEKMHTLMMKHARQFHRADTNQLRAACFGQDRFCRSYWKLLKADGIFIEALESAQNDTCSYQEAL